MIVGKIRYPRDPVVRFRIYGNANGIAHEIEATVDTGFTEQLTLTDDLIDALELLRLRDDTTTQSDGTEVKVTIHDGEIEWNGSRITVDVQSGGVEPPVGMGLIWGYTLTVRGETDGLVTVKAFNEEMVA